MVVEVACMDFVFLDQNDAPEYDFLELECKSGGQIHEMNVFNTKI